MPPQEKNLFASMITMLGLLLFFFPKVYQMHQAGKFDGSEGLVLLGKTGLIFVAVGVAGVIVAIILLSITQAIVTGKSEPMELTDERDRLIERRGTQIAEIMRGIGIVSAMAALALGYAAVPVFFVIILASVFAEFFAGFAKIAMYRLGW